jgi:GTP:adenosylcobinamide-phosphate guanylyltransferase
MDAVVIAGGRPQPGEPLYPYTQGNAKALLDVCGKPMIQWVLDALCAAETIEHVLIIGLPSDVELSCSKAVAFMPDQGGLLQNLRAGMKRVREINPSSQYILSVSSDIPAITAAMVDWVVKTALETKDEVYYNVIKRAVMEQRYPNSRRSYTRLKGLEVCGGDMNVISAVIGTEREALWERIIAARKNVFKQAALIGYDTLILLLLRLINLDQAVRLVTKRLGLKGRAVVCPYAEVGMDVDKPFQLEIIRSDLASKAVA